jgi:hypothetical protein
VDYNVKLLVVIEKDISFQGRKFKINKIGCIQFFQFLVAIVNGHHWKRKLSIYPLSFLNSL